MTEERDTYTLNDYQARQLRDYLKNRYYDFCNMCGKEEADQILEALGADPE